MDTGRWLTPIEVNMARTNRSHTKILPDTDRYLTNSEMIVNKQKCRTKEMDRVDGLTDRTEDPFEVFMMVSCVGSSDLADRYKI